MLLSIKHTCCSDMASKASLLAGEASAMKKNSSHFPGTGPQWYWTQSFQHSSLGRPKIDIVLLVWCHQYWAGRHNCPWSDGCAFPNVVQHTVCLMQNKSIFLFCVWLGIHCYPAFFSAELPVLYWPVSVHKQVFCVLEQVFAFFLVEHQRFPDYWPFNSSKASLKQRFTIYHFLLP